MAKYMNPKPGKGSRPRNNFSDAYRANYDTIKWGKKADKQNTASSHAGADTLR